MKKYLFLFAVLFANLAISQKIIAVKAVMLSAATTTGGGGATAETAVTYKFVSTGATTLADGTYNAGSSGFGGGATVVNNFGNSSTFSFVVPSPITNLCRLYLATNTTTDPSSTGYNNDIDANGGLKISVDAGVLNVNATPYSTVVSGDIIQVVASNNFTNSTSGNLTIKRISGGSTTVLTTITAGNNVGNEAIRISTSFGTTVPTLKAFGLY